MVAACMAAPPTVLLHVPIVESLCLHTLDEHSTLVMPLLFVTACMLNSLTFRIFFFY